MDETVTDETVTRSTIVPAPVDDVWEAVADPEQLRCWLAPETEVELTPGAEGRLVGDDGVERRVVVDEVERGRRVSLRWWPSQCPAAASRVELVLTPAVGVTVVTVTETRLAPVRLRAGATIGTGSLLALGFVAVRTRAGGRVRA